MDLKFYGGSWRASNSRTPALPGEAILTFMLEMSSARLDLKAALPALERLASELYSKLAPPPVGLVRQRLAPPRLENLEVAVETAVRRLAESIEPKGPLAVGVGSRGIAELGTIVRVALRALQASGFEPFIVPAMGSHGGATAAGQAAVLADYGIDEARLGVQVRATMETVELGQVAGVPVHLDRNVVEAGRVLVINRVKPHTDFSGTIESGPAKMAAIGLGKQRGAQQIHAAGVRGLRDVMPEVARFLVARGILVGGLVVIENSLDQTAEVHGLLGSEIAGPPEEKLLRRAYELMPKIPFDVIDVLVVDRMGKDISGTGMDTNVINRLRIPGEEEPAGTRIASIVPLDLTDASHGNAAGIGLAEFIPVRLGEKVDLASLYANAFTAGIVGLERGQLPMILPTDRDAVLAAIATSGRTATEPLRLAWIADTLHTETIAVSPALLEGSASRGDLEILSAARPLPFDSAGRLAPLPGFVAHLAGLSEKP